jgi:two-component system sensor histidine kinase/response regulator
VKRFGRWSITRLDSGSNHALTDGFIEQDGNLVITAWDDQAEQMFGWTAAEVIGRPSRLLVPDRNRERHDLVLHGLLAAPPEGTVSQYLTAVHKSGREFKLDATVSIVARDGRPHVRVQGRPAREVVEARLQETEQTFRTLIDSLEDGYFEVDLKGMFTLVNDAYCRMTGWPREALLGQSFKELVRGEDQAKATIQAYKQVYKTGEPLRAFEHRLVRRDGSTRAVEDTVSLKRDSRGQPIGFVGIRRDCTERHDAAERLKLSEERYRLILDSIEDGYFEIDLSRKGRYVFVNDAFCRTAGFTRDELIGQSYVKFFDPDTAALLYDAYHKVYLTGESLKALAYGVVGKDGSTRYVEESVSLRKDASGAVVGFMGIRRDVTARTVAEREIANAKEAAEAANRAKSEFLANMSHEIRTPMNGIIGMTELALDTELTPYQVDCLATVRSSAESLLTILNDILDFSKIESGKLDLEQVPFSLDDTINDTVRPLAVRAHQKGLELITDIRTDLAEVFVGDPVRLRQILTNLVGNAIKFTEHGHVMLVVGESARDAGRVTLRFAVSDTGLGIAKDKHQTIFEAFRQADGSTTRRFGGTGLGLAISSTLVRMMGGEIAITSAPGEGSTFEFSATFPLAAAASVSIRPARLTNVRALIVDDNAVNRGIFEGQLLRWGMQPVSVDSGEAAIRALTAAAAKGTPFQVVLLDAQMPDLDGFDVAARVAAEPVLAGTTILMLTSGGRYGDSMRCRELGITTYLTKPVKQADLFDGICRALDGGIVGPSRIVAAPILATDAVRRARVLLAEDNVVNQRVAVGLLERRGHVVTVAENGRAAVEALRSRSFDVVLMDVQMPEMGGLEATALIRASEQGTVSRVRIIAMTAHAMSGDRERCLAAGMDGYLAKPIDPIALFAAVEEGIAGSCPEDEPSAAPIVDREAALLRMDGDHELLAEVQQVFVSDSPRRLAAIRGAVANRDAERLRAEGHDLRGSAGTLGALRLVEAARALERAGTEGYLDEAETAGRRVALEIERLVAHLASEHTAVTSSPR